MNILQFPKPGPPSTSPFWMPFQLQRSYRPHNPLRSPAAPAASQLAPLAGKRVLVMVDDDNIRISSRQVLGRSVSYRSLAREIRTLTATCELHAFFTSVPGDDSRLTYFKRCRYRTLDLKRDYEDTPKGRVVKSNADFDLVFEAAFRIALVGFDALLVASGDGDLVLSIARGVQRVLPGVEVFTLSVPNCTSARMLQRNSPQLIAANFMVDSSMLCPVGVRASRELAGGRHVS